MLSALALCNSAATAAQVSVALSKPSLRASTPPTIMSCKMRRVLPMLCSKFVPEAPVRRIAVRQTRREKLTVITKR